jgi:hypothetical protein
MLKLQFSQSLDDDVLIDSGFGPYALTRLCYETGGIYFAVHPNRNTDREVRDGEIAVSASYLKRFFDPEVMRRYRPDYCSLREYQEILEENKARQALVSAAQQDWLSPLADPRLVFPVVSEAQFAASLTEAQNIPARLEVKVVQLYETLKMGEKARSTLTGPRWQAGFDLAMGRVLAVKVRTEGYNAMLAKAKMGMEFDSPEHDTWRLVPDQEITVGSVLAKQAEQSREYLKRVVDNHPETPWAILAERELDQPLGWRWVSNFTGVNAPPMVAMAGNDNPVPESERPRMAPPPPPRRPPPKL